ncbi:MAG: phospholipase [Pirellulales bacterium]|nr:phospholipase [Pirellulales bacterium]
MTFPAGSLLELHRIHQQLSDLEDRLERGPKQVRARQGNVTRLEEELNSAKNQVKQTMMQADQKQLQLKSNEAKIKELRVKLNQCSTNREFQALKDQIAADEMANSVLADEILEALEKVDDLKRLVIDAEGQVAKGREELAKVETTVREQEGLIRGDIDRLRAELATAEALLPVDVRDGYDRIVRSRGSDALASVQGDVCGGCFQQLTPNMANELLLGRVVFCKSCGRMLYLSEERTPGKG